MDILEATCKVSIETELAKNPELDRSMIDSLQDWAKKQPHLPPILDTQMAIFLVVCKFSIEKAKKLIDIHFTMKTHFKELFNSRDPLSQPIQDAMDCVYVTALKGFDHSGRRVNYSALKPGAFTDTSRYHGPTTTKLIYMFEDLSNFTMGSHVPGVTLVMDATGFGMSHLSTLSLSFLKQTSLYFTQGASVIVNQIIVVNANPVAERLIALLRPILPTEIFKRIHILPRDKADKIFDYIPRDVVPSDLGGGGQSVAELTKETYQLILDSREFYLTEERLQRVNAALRPAGNSPGSKIESDMSGSFKKLDLD
uniref:Alpha-tocopherol transfer protein-like n=1 Tax=Cacopsylla melanoneura TaxID=428564 RepID=A0A8D8RPN4_9HEMI